MPNQKGVFIDSEIANSEINQFLKIRNESYEYILSKLESENASVESKTFYADTVTSYFFDKETILKLFDETSEQESNALRVYCASDPDKGGKTTVVLVAAKIEMEEEEIVKISNVFSDDATHAAIEFPGAGIRKLENPTPVIDILNDDIIPPNIV